MTTVVRSLGRVIGTVGRAVRWSFASVEDEPEPYLVPMAGVPHGPVRSITLRVDTDARRPRSSVR
jgi:hypothetical protein